MRKYKIAAGRPVRRRDGTRAFLEEVEERAGILRQLGTSTYSLAFAAPGILDILSERRE